ncbi:hypothetical protein BJP34_14475 [Moorena producens PAL-8-15-08-1]|uniref:Uncharacterized protein n=1 Tax=Moorena producens PAL-8-15-08-1 TaxID=1458985 RepID=A0A1D8TS79_9CYAN|nr:hypothetical protein [Moorena producens]AOX00500.1 hypothetical protein BJP34_14475 [Moorena producens PAL-8-15-08-1]
MNTQQINNSLKKNNGSTDQLVSDKAGFKSLRDQELKLNDDDLELTDDNLEEVVGGFMPVGFFTPSA